MTTSSIEQDFKRKVCDSVRIEAEGMDRFRVFTPFQFDDGDHLAIALRRAKGRWMLTDEGHTFMHLSYELDEKELQKGNRQKIVDNALHQFSVENQDGELLLGIEGDRYGDALYSFVQALLKIRDVTFLSRERQKSDFLGQFRSLLEDAVPANRRTFSWHDPQRDEGKKYLVDCRVNGMARPMFVFALPNNDRVRDSTIVLMKFESWNVRARSVGIFENQEDIGRAVLARFSDACEKQFSSLKDNETRIRSYLSEVLAGG